MSAQTIFCVLRYEDAQRGIDFLERAFGFERRSIHEEGGVVLHAELALGESVVLIGSVTEGEFGELAPPPGHAALYVVVDDADAHHDRAVSEGAPVVMDLRDQEYGSREYAARDPEGNLWTFGTYDPWDA